MITKPIKGPADVKVPQTMGATELDSLAFEWQEIKRQEDNSREHRLLVEQKIIKLAGVKEEGAATTHGKYFKVTTTGKVSRVLDAAKWNEIYNQIPEQYRPVRYAPQIDLKALRVLEKMPETYKVFAQALTIRPQKPAVSIEEL